MTAADTIIKDDAFGELVGRSYIAHTKPSQPWRLVWIGFVDRSGSEETCVNRDATAAYRREVALREALTNIRFKIRFVNTEDDALASSLTEIEQTINAVLDP